ncbi:MAG: hypothetical protein GXO58_05045 [Thermodesulfobacteria bacterium]|nr:hypothetical protein [Thermodesulfobacteriota bacterium]
MRRILTTTILALAVACMISQVVASPVPYQVAKCLVGRCWSKVNVDKISEEKGCPTPMLVINNVLREMNGYLAASKFLGLSDEQVKKLRVARYRTRKSIVEGKSRLNLLSIDLLDNMAKDDFQLQEVEKIISDLKSSCSNLIYGVVIEAVEARKVLTPEQRQKAIDLAE